ncbi:spodomicin-like [Choristoneura fumiferana]|uniref:spodomicin-like n=1 Tax=Choristoneura fumiferana TaxID=7141 RepID=UPI003D15A354
MAALKTMFVLVLMAIILASAVAVRVGPCDQVCTRGNAERDECCRAHGYRGHSSCAGAGMNCY